MNEKNWYWYEETKENTIRILRVFGANSEVIIPDNISGKKVTEIGAYCFAPVSHVKEECLMAEEDSENSVSTITVTSTNLTDMLDHMDKKFARLLTNHQIAQICGDILQSVSLPDTVTSIGNLACYQCKNLENFICSKELIHIGSDAFMNCHNLIQIQIKGSIQQPSGLKQILAQRRVATRVFFQNENKIEAGLFYPEYTEYYDEIGPAHIFELCIEGEGFRTRQCFQNGIVNLRQYDEAFEKAKTTEDIKALCQIAGMRLYYPINLLKEFRECYEEYLKSNMEEYLKILLKEKREQEITFLCETGYLNHADYIFMIQKATEMEWSQGVGTILSLQEKYCTYDVEDEYSFEDFE